MTLLLTRSGLPLLLVSWTACDGAALGPSADDPAQVGAGDGELGGIVAHLSLPFNGGCVRVRLTGPKSKTVHAPVVGGAASITLGRLPAGAYSALGEAFTGACPPAGDVAWSTAPTPFEVDLGTSQLDLALRFRQHRNVVVESAFEPRLEQIEIGWSLTAVRDSDGHVYAWGDGGSLDFASLEPIPLPGFAGASDIAVGTDFMCAILDGVVHCAGNNEERELGRTGPSSPVPSAVVLPALAIGVEASVTGNRACALLENHELWCWGRTDLCDTFICPPTLMAEDVVDVALGWEGITVLTKWGTVVSTVGQGSPLPISGHFDTISRGSLRCASSPFHEVSCHFGASYQRMEELDGAVVVSRSSDIYLTRTCIVRSGGQVACSGYAAGDGNETTVTLVPVLDGAASVSVGPHTSCAIDPVSGGWCWGENQGGFGNDIGFNWFPRRLEL